MMGSRQWEIAESEMIKWLGKTYDQAIGQYILQHKDDWILDLPVVVRDFLLKRRQAMESGSWWEKNYRPSTKSRFVH